MARTIIRPGLLDELATTRGLTTTAMADLGHVTPDTYDAIRNGAVPPWFFTLRIADAFGLGMRDLLTLTDTTALAASESAAA